MKFLSNTQLKYLKNFNYIDIQKNASFVAFCTANYKLIKQL